MTYTLLIRLTGPMQAWGLQSRFSIRDTAREPTKSGVLGLVCAALGRSRDAPLDDLAALPMAVRVDQEGHMRRDFHTAQNIVKASAKIRPGKPISSADLKDTEPSIRHYLADAWYTVGLQSEDRNLLEKIDAALAAPRWPLFLGRKAFVPGLPVCIVDGHGKPVGLQEGTLLEVLIPFIDPHHHAPRPDEEPYRLVFDADLPHAGLNVVAERMQPDLPISFRNRRFLPRQVIVAYSQSPSSDVSQ